MTNVKIPALPTVASLSGQELLELVQGYNPLNPSVYPGQSFKASATAIANTATLFPSTATQIIAGVGLAGGGTLSGNVTLSLDINELVAKVTPVIADTVAINDSANNAPAQVTLSNFYKSIAGLTTLAAPSATNDYVVLYHAADGTPYKVTPASIVSVVGALPIGGTTGQILDKVSGTNYDAQWVNLVLTGDVTTNSALPAPTVITANAVTYAKFQKVAALSVVGNGTNALADSAAITGTANQALVVNAAGTSLAFGQVSLTAGVIGVLPEVNGGTNQSTYTLGNILYASATNTLSKLAGNITTGKQFLSQTGTGVVSAAPAWATITGADVTGAALTKSDDTNVTLTLGGAPTTALLTATSLTLGWTGNLAVTRGGIGTNTLTNHGVLLGQGTSAVVATAVGATGTALAGNTGADPTFQTISALLDNLGATQGQILYRNATVWTVLAPGSSGQVLQSGGAAANVSWLTVTGTGTVTSIDVSGGTTGLTFSGGPVTTTGTITMAGDLIVANGGTGRATLTNHGVLIGAGTTAITQLAAAAAGTLLTGQGASADPSFSATPTLGIAGTTLGTLALTGNTSGTVTITPQAAAGTATLTLPNASGTFAISATAPLVLSATTGNLTITGSALTKVDDTNVTLTLGGTPATSLLVAASLTLGWTGQLAVARGGTGLAALTAHYLIIGNGTTAATLLAPSATSGVPLISQGSSADPAYGTAVVAGGGTGIATATAYSVICAGTTATGAFQSLAALGATGTVLTSNGAGALPSFQAAASAAVLQCLQNTYTTNASLTVAIPYDDTVPTSSEGTQILSQAVTPADNTNKVLCEVTLQVNGGNNAVCVALYRGTTCISATFVASAALAGSAEQIAFSFLDSPASASAQTYTVRVGGDDTSAIRLNGLTSGRKFGGVSAATLTVSEINA